jgi:hypothetical protein
MVMAHYAFLDQNNIVTEVIVGVDETELIEGLTPEEWYADFKGQACVRTSYNANIRKNYAGIGSSYNVELDAFIPPAPYPSWILDEETCQWQAPVSMPTDGQRYYWVDVQQNWSTSVLPEYVEPTP